MIVRRKWSCPQPVKVRSHPLPDETTAQSKKAAMKKASGASDPGITHAIGSGGRGFDSDNDVDQDAFAIFQRCISGEGNPANPNCAD